MVLPADLDHRHLRDVLIHECAHVIRGDLLVALVQRLAAVVLWPHPAIHHLNRQLGRAREEVCDNFVLRANDARGYARTLLALSERRPAAVGYRPALGIVGVRWSLVDRVASLLDPRRDRLTSASHRARLAALASLAGVTLALGLIRLEGPARLSAAPIVAGSQAQDGGGRRISGVVVDERGRPVPGAAVRPARPEHANEVATTADDGRFSLPLRGRFYLEDQWFAEADDGAWMGLGTSQEPHASTPSSQVRIVLKPSRSVVIRVADARGAAVPGAVVEVVDFSFCVAGLTSREGSATLRIPADAKARWVVARKAGVGFDYFENYRTAHAPDLDPLPAEVSLVLDGAATVRIKAVDTSRRPVAGIRFVPWYVAKRGKLQFANIGGSTTGLATTGANGVAKFDWLPTHPAEDVPFLIHDEGYSCPEPPNFQGGGQADLTARTLREVRLSGLVKQADGRTAAGVLIQAEGRGATNHYCRTYARTGPDGRYDIDVSADQMYVIAVVDESSAARSLTNIVAREGVPQSGLDFVLSRGTRIEGAVTRGPRQGPAAGVSLSLIEDGASVFEGPDAPIGGKDGDHTLVRFATTDEQGRYRFRVGVGRFRILMPGSSEQSAEVAVAQPAAETIIRDFHLAGPERTRTFEGRAVEKAATGDRPLAGAMIEVVGLGHRRGFEARADGEGTFRGPRRDDGPLVVYARSADGKLAGFTVVPAESDDGTASATPASRVMGRVVDRAGRPRAGVRVQVRFARGSDFAASGHIKRHVRTDDQGRYELDGAVVGSFGEVMVRADDPRMFTVDVERFAIRGEDPVELPDMTIPADSPKAHGPADAGPGPGELQDEARPLR